jgi:hypothetical protein
MVWHTELRLLFLCAAPGAGRQAGSSLVITSADDTKRVLAINLGPPAALNLIKQPFILYYSLWLGRERTFFINELARCHNA